MAKNLVIVESPAKAKTIEKFLGTDFKVMSSYGHIADLPAHQLGIDVANNFKPTYVVSEDKHQVLKALREQVKQAQTIWLASDEDREGEAISWHLAQELKLSDAKTKRIVFNSITKTAIEKAIANPRSIDYNLVDAQQARRVLDRLVGYELSPVLWKKIKRGLSAGRVQSVAVRLIVEREREITQFATTCSYKVVAEFLTADNKLIKAKLGKSFESEKHAADFLTLNASALFSVENLEVKPTKKSPAPPFTTSTLQQEASRKLGFSVSRTMQVAQRLYEAGYITYMRTDSVNLSSEAIKAAEQAIINLYGKKYSHPRQFATHVKGAQEAHEAIRPTDMAVSAISAENEQMRLYELIYKRTLACQMTDATLERTLVKITASTHSEHFAASGEVISFDGFLKVYLEGKDDDETEEEGMLPALKIGQELQLGQMTATESFTRAPYRYTEASLVKKLEELGIGRPSTYAATISTIQNREYVSRSAIEGQLRSYGQLVLSKGSVNKKTLVETVGADKGKLIPTEIGYIVNDFLVAHFHEIMDYNFTAKVEEAFDDIASGKAPWNEMVQGFYEKFHPNVINVEQHAERETGERLLGIDPISGKPISVRLGRYGALVQIGSQDDEQKKFASLQAGQTISTITLEEALKLFELPRLLGEFQGKKVMVNIGRFGPYIHFGEAFISLGKGIDVYEITFEEVQKIILQKQKDDAPIASYQGLEVTKGKGRFGPFIKWNDMFINVSKKYNFDALTQADIEELIADKLRKESEKLVKEWVEEGIRIEKARWGRYSLIKDTVKVELSKETDIESLTLVQVQELLAPKKVAKNKTTTKKTNTKKATAKK